jgi:hypothetical protein
MAHRLNLCVQKTLLDENLDSSPSSNLTTDPSANEIHESSPKKAPEEVLEEGVGAHVVPSTPQSLLKQHFQVHT